MDKIIINDKKSIIKNKRSYIIAKALEEFIINCFLRVMNLNFLLYLNIYISLKGKENKVAIF
jgi:hypothetical protein